MSEKEENGIGIGVPVETYWALIRDVRKEESIKEIIDIIKSTIDAGVEKGEDLQDSVIKVEDGLLTKKVRKALLEIKHNGFFVTTDPNDEKLLILKQQQQEENNNG